MNKWQNNFQVVANDFLNYKPERELCNLYTYLIAFTMALVFHTGSSALYAFDNVHLVLFQHSIRNDLHWNFLADMHFLFGSACS